MSDTQNPTDAPSPKHSGAGDDPTADYRKYPKGPNFLLIVLLACAVLLVCMAAAVFVVGGFGKKMVPQTPNPTPNSLVRPLHGPSGIVAA
jgi:hypothetical protein